MRHVLIPLAVAGLAGCAATPPAATPAPVDFRGGAPTPASASAPANVTRIEVPGPQAAPAAADLAPPPQVAAPSAITASPLPPPAPAASAAAPAAPTGPDPRELRAGVDPLNPLPSITVNPGESLWDIAEIFKVPLRALIDANSLAPPYAVEPGQTLTIPPPRIHVVQAGETLFQIAQRYAIDQRSLAVYNRLERPFNVRVGQRIALPALARDRFAGLEPQDLAAVLSGREQAAVARRPASVTAEAASAAAIAAGAASAATAPAVTRPATPAPAPPLPPSAPPPAPSGAPTPPARPSGPPTISMSFQWPVEGDIIETFGPKQGGRRNDGINIAAPEGAPFRAAAAGEVAYAGNEIPGYGWLVLVRHEGGIITAYAHARGLKVAEGDRVRAGQVLGEVGASGRVSRPQLHFEIRRGVTPIDPLRELPRRAGA